MPRTHSSGLLARLRARLRGRPRDSEHDLPPLSATGAAYDGMSAETRAELESFRGYHDHRPGI